jgi:hypothetical protein
MTNKPASTQAAGRLALREEGDFWNAYYAMPGTMFGAILLGSIQMGIIRDRPRRKAQFMALMREAVGDILKDVTGSRPVSWDERPAPEDERGGSA